MNKAIALAPMLLLLIPGMLVTTELTARNFRIYLPFFAILVIALAINMYMMVWHRKRQEKLTNR